MSLTPWMTSKGSELSCHPQKVLQYSEDRGHGKQPWKSWSAPSVPACDTVSKMQVMVALQDVVGVEGLAVVSEILSPKPPHQGRGQQSGLYRLEATRLKAAE